MPRTITLKPVFVEEPGGDLSRVTTEEAQRRINSGSAELLKFEGKIKRIRMVSKPFRQVRGDCQITKRIERAVNKLGSIATLDRSDFERVVIDRGAGYRKAVIAPGVADPWTLNTLPIEATIVLPIQKATA